MNNLLAKRLKEERINYGLSQQTLADIVSKDIGEKISRVSISRYETGERIPNYKILNALSMALNSDIDYLLGNKNIKHDDLYYKGFEHYKEQYLSLVNMGENNKNSILLELQYPLFSLISKSFYTEETLNSISKLITILYDLYNLSPNNIDSVNIYIEKLLKDGYGKL